MPLPMAYDNILTPAAGMGSERLTTATSAPFSGGIHAVVLFASSPLLPG